MTIASEIAARMAAQPAAALAEAEHLATAVEAHWRSGRIFRFADGSGIMVDDGEVVELRRARRSDWPPPLEVKVV